MAKVKAQVGLEELKKIFTIDVYPDGFWITSKQVVPTFINIKFHNLVDWDNYQLHRRMAEEVLARLVEILKLDKEYKEKPSEVYGHPAGQSSEWYVDVVGYYDTVNWGGLAYFKCPSVKPPYIDIKYSSGSPETPAVCKLLLDKKELERLPRNELVLIDDKDRKLKVLLPYYHDRENDIIIAPARVNISLNTVCFKGKCYTIKYSGASIIDRRNKVFTVVHDADIFKPIIVKF